MLFTEATDSRPLPILAGVGALNDDNPTMTDRLLGHNFKVLPAVGGQRPDDGGGCVGTRV